MFSKETGSSTSYMRKYFRIQNRECLMRIYAGIAIFGFIELLVEIALLASVLGK
ncbi:hypothetical protein A4W24_001688 [Salmonella enterica subsp. enterica serovar Horsham]|nr:hypothetical protein [Salmonella enterica subsp. enterica serovar Horsham]EDT3721992.1 hypothetical protein [Salmonella enterica subsp. enterica serovar Horsham]